MCFFIYTTQAQVYAYVCVSLYIYIYTCVCICTHTHTHRCTVCLYIVSSGSNLSDLSTGACSPGYRLLQQPVAQLAAINPNFAPFPASNLFNSLVGIYVSKPVWEQKTGAPLLDTKDRERVRCGVLSVCAS